MGETEKRWGKRRDRGRGKPWGAWICAHQKKMTAQCDLKDQDESTKQNREAKAITEAWICTGTPPNLFWLSNLTCSSAMYSKPPRFCCERGKYVNNFMCLFFFFLKKSGIQTDTIIFCNNINLLEHHHELEGKYWKLLELGMFRQYEK